MHSSNTKSALTCDKCGAMFKWKSELQIHEHLHTAMEQKAAKLSASNGTTAASKQQSASKTPAAMASSQLAMPMPSVLPSSLALLFSYFAETNGTNCPEATTSASDSVDNSNSNDHAIGLDLTNYKIKTETESRQFEQEVPLIVPKKKIKQEAKSPNSLDSSDDALSLFKENPYQPPKVSSALGEIKETAPGQFKCRFCDKTFDRIFSVHRHERVHTGYKPCVCDVCGRRFSEKRNLRHHIIRFHSDGSGRELLKRARKDKTLAATAKQLASTVLKNAVLEC
ncbi:Sal-like protein 4 [Halotydeus destructor]|nr:Sal-like protein 4 [Halotydeus destructor]